MLRKMAEKKPVAWAVKWKTGGGLSFLTEDYPTGMYVGADDEQYAVPLYAAPVPAITAEQKAEARRLRDWATTYLSTGGLFNPELAQHRVVSDLILECRDYLDKIGGQG